MSESVARRPPDERSWYIRSRSRQRIAENRQSFDVALGEEDVSLLHGLAGG